ncbi:MAG: hypothetical protein VKK42_24290 [Lyngbya sp.]|nr:hypothetical protein [Lyngbya sp.]
MPYSQFTIEQIKDNFEISLVETVASFANIPEVEYSQFLQETLDYNIPLALAIASEKARSEMIITPILIEVKKQLDSKISLFSGKEFEVDAALGLTGFCDYLISLSPEQLVVESPIIAVVEAKNDRIETGLGQCMAEMIAAQIFNQRKKNEIKTIYGVVTTGSLWKFMKLEGKTIEVDLNEYFLNPVGKIIAIFKAAITSNSVLM